MESLSEKRKIYKYKYLKVDMKNKKILALIVVLPILVTVFIVAMQLNQPKAPTTSNALEYHSLVEVYTSGDFDGRVSEPHTGELELLDAGHNTLTNIGANAIRAALGYGLNSSAFNYIGLCNATASGSCTAEAAASASLDNEFTQDGLQRAAGAYLATNTGNWSVSKTFTAGVNGMQTNKTGLFNASAGTGVLFAEKTFTLATLQSSDTILVNWTVWVTGS